MLLANVGRTRSRCANCFPPGGPQRTLLGFLRARKAPETLQTHLTALRKALQAQDSEALREVYPSYARFRSRDSQPASTSSASTSVALSEMDLLAVMKLIVTGSKHLTRRDYRLVQRIFQDMEQSYGQSPGILAHHFLLRAMVKAGRPNEALRWIRSMHSSYSVLPRIQEWNLVLNGFTKKPPSQSKESLEEVVDKFDQTWEAMEASGVSPDLFSYNSRLSVLFLSGAIDQVPTILEASRTVGGPDKFSYATIIKGYIEASQIDLAEQAGEEVYEIIERTAGKEMDVVAWNALVKLAALTGGWPKVQSVVHKWLDLPGPSQPDAWTLSEALLSHVDNLYGQTTQPADEARQRLRHAVELVGVAPTNHAAAILIQELINQASGPAAHRLGFRTAKAFYDHVTTGPQAVQPSPAMVHPLLTIGTRSSSLDFAACKKLYQDLLDPIDTANANVSYLPDESIYSTLLKGCAVSGSEGLTWALTLLEDMKSAGVVFSSPDIALSHIKQLFKNATSIAEAFKVYAWVQAVDQRTLDAKGYQAVLSEFTQTSFHNADGVPTYNTPINVFLEILKDMRAAGYATESASYILLLKYYSRQSIRPELVKRLHDIIKMDALFDPDIALNNALIVAYGRVGNFTAAMNQWRSMLVNRKRPGQGIDNITISAILDVCGWAGAKDMAYSVWKTCQMDQLLQLNKRNWDTWIECLARLNLVQEACETVCDEMQTQQNGAPQPDEVTVTVLVRFARRAGKEHFSYVRKRLEDDLPDLWAALDPVLKSEEEWLQPQDASRQSQPFQPSAKLGGSLLQMRWVTPVV